MRFFSLVPAVCGRPEKDCRETMAGVLLRSFTMAGSQADGEGQRNCFLKRLSLGYSLCSTPSCL